MALPSVEIAVRDAGIGLGAEHHDLVFEKFYQVGTVALHSSRQDHLQGRRTRPGPALVRGVYVPTAARSGWKAPDTTK